MITLGIETSGRAGSVALAIDGQPAGEVNLSASGRRHARTLVSEIQTLLKSAGRGPRDVQVLAVSIGPGSFTGLRVGVVCAKTYAYAISCKLIAVDTFLALAASHSNLERIWVIDDPLRGDVFAGEYRQVNGIWECTTPSSLMSLDDWKSRLPPDAVITGPGLQTLSSELSGWKLTDAATWIPQARDIVTVGEQLVTSGLVTDPWTMAPFYMRRSAAEEKADQKPAATSSPDPAAGNSP